MVLAFLTGRLSQLPPGTRSRYFNAQISLFRSYWSGFRGRVPHDQLGIDNNFAVRGCRLMIGFNEALADGMTDLISRNVKSGQAG